MDIPAVDAGPAVDAIEYTSFASAIDLMAVRRQDIQALEIVTATTGASIQVTLPGASATRTMTVSQGDRLPIRARSIVGVTNITRVRVYWGRY